MALLLSPISSGAPWGDISQYPLVTKHSSASTSTSSLRTWTRRRPAHLCSAVNPESPVPWSARNGLQHHCVCSAQLWAWAKGVHTPHVQKIFSNHSSLFLSKIRFIPFFLLSTNHSFVNFEHLVKNPCLCLVCLREWPLVIAILTKNTAQ